METLQSVVISTNAPEQFPPEVHAELAEVVGTKSICVTPLVSRARALGVLVVGRITDNPLSAEEIDFIGKVAGPIANAVENALAYA